MQNIKKYAMLSLVLMVIYHNTSIVFAQDQDVEDATQLESEKAVPEEEVPEEKIYFVSSQRLLINDFRRTLSSIGVVTLSVGTALALTTLLSSELIVLGSDGKTTFDDGYIALHYYDFHLYDVLYMTSITFMSVGVITLFVGTTFKPATNTEYLRWKKNQKIFGFTTSSLGLATLAGGITYWIMNGIDTVDISEERSAVMILMGLGSILTILGIPSIILGTTSIL